MEPSSTAPTKRDERGTGGASPVWTVLISFPLCFVLYLAFTGNMGKRELVASGISSLLASIATARLATSAELRFHLRFRDWIRAWRMPGYLVSGTGEVFIALAHQLFAHKGAASLLAKVPFEIGDKEDPAEAGRRALATFYTTATPNFVVLGLIEEQGVMLYHQVLPGKVLTMAKELGARP